MYNIASRYEESLLDLVMHNPIIEYKNEVTSRIDQQNAVCSNVLPQVQRSIKNVSGKQEYSKSIYA